ncbi:MAG: proline--tRNA ligase [Candidatus Omnitrophota bacterium]
MRWTSSFIPTLKEDPQEAEAVSHKLMIRAGLIRRLIAGTYTYLPMGYNALKKAKDIVREEMNRSGAVELLMPALQPPELWKKTGRYDDIGDVMIKYKDRHGKEVALGPTHEEVITDLVAGEVRSYKDLPLILYQIQTKFRDEVRPRFGVVRSCEFIMKDAYSFDVDEESMEVSYKKMYDAYCRIFDRCGLSYIAVEADPGLMGGKISHEFMVPSDIGEGRIAVCSSCDYAASTEVAATCPGEEGRAPGSGGKMEEVSTPGVSTVENVSKFLKVKPSDLIKTLIYIADGDPIAILVRGDHEANETKIKNSLKAKALELADEKKVKDLTGGPMGFSGPVGLSSVRIIADNAVRCMASAVTGANKKDKHLKGVNPTRDFKIDEWIDARVITSEDPCPKCGEKIELKEAIEVGHTFKLGTKYSESLGAKFLDEKGKERPAIMGCYGIGVNRILASLIENSHDKDGIIWPTALAPAEVSVIPVSGEDKGVINESEKIYDELKGAGLEVILDDREKTAGVKFKDSDLVGFPLQIVIGKKNLDQGKIEIKDRATGEKTLIKKNEVLKRAKKMLGYG